MKYFAIIPLLVCAVAYMTQLYVRCSPASASETARIQEILSREIKTECCWMAKGWGGTP